MVGVLVLVDQDVPEPAPICLGDIREVLQQMHRRHDQVVEVERVRLGKRTLVAPVRLGEHLFVRARSPVGPRLRRHQLVLEVADLRRQRARRVALGVEVEVTPYQGHQPLRVVGVVDREGRPEAEGLGLGTQDAHAHRVERADPHRLGARADEGAHPLLHLAGGLVGEGDRQDLTRVRPAGGEQVGDPVGQHPGLARAGAGDDQQRRARRGRRPPAAAGSGRRAAPPHRQTAASADAPAGAAPAG